ncbi:ABC transporter ATP-binding protein [Tropicimonas isoalkanivorans]|uniref:ATP-binding cassette, subfamily B, MsbA n=1 Tax=Tropicimonas isoalkanivorans TaxID=441112 RepID=A0A1I1N303_9RHOB|nr:ABC transporter ATP-binding protein [Tropicimonas isoalkanivorans]SFC92031.1 ATP-binding cassette, subfamily B, MsbA [Tropicimonas isoalkanivorans]
MKALALRLLRPRAGQFLLVALLIASGSLAGLALPLAAGRIVAGLVGDAVEVSPALLLATLAFLAVQNGLTYLSNVRSERLATHVLAELRRTVYAHVQRLPLDFHESRPRGATMSVLVRDVDFVGQFMTSFAVSMVPLLVTLAGASVAMLSLDVALALPILVVIPVAIIAFRLLARHFRPLSLELRDAEGQVLDRLEETIGMIRTIKSFGREPLEDLRFAEAVADARDLRCRLEHREAALRPAIQFLSGAAVLLLFWAIGARLSGSGLSTSEWTALLLYSGMIIRPLSGLAGSWGMVQIARGSVARLDDVLRLAPEDLPPDWAETPRLTGEISFLDVGFCYPNGTRVLDEVSFTIREGTVAGLLGRNGAGKSTVLKLIEGLYLPSDGTVLVGGQPTSEQDLTVLRRNVIVVSQQVQLVDGSVRDNIAYGRPDAPEEAVIAAARRALAHDFIQSLDRGYETAIGENGVRLSGGQRQRLALARALLCDPPILLLDEATAMFDLEGEDAFFSTCAEAFAGRTVIIVGHTPKVFDAVDLCLTVENGHVFSSDLPQERKAHAGE